jgi:hypothetical protein
MASYSYRQYVEVAHGEFINVEQLFKNPNHMVAAIEFIRGELREVLRGLAPVLGPDVLLNVCREVLAEDDGNCP